MLTAALLICALAVVSVYGVDESDVVVLDSENFDEFIAGDTVLVEFYAPWCGHCKSLVPEYAEAATALAADDPPVRLGKVDATVHQELATRFAVQGYPTLKVFHNGKESAYGGPRQAAGIIAYMRKQAGPAARKLDAADALAEFRAAGADDVVVVGVFAGDAEARTAFEQQAGQLRDSYRFGVIGDAALAKKLGLADGSVSVFRPTAWKGEEERVSTDAASELGNLAAWLPTAAVPLAGIMTENVASRYEALGLPRFSLYAALNAERDPAGVRYFMNRLRKAARDFTGKLVFAGVDASRGQGQREFTEFAFPGSAKFALGIIDTAGKKFAGPADLSTADPKILAKFAQQYLDGELSPYVKSEPVPADNDGPVTVVVGSQFDDLVINNDKDVLLEVYAPWCGHCKTLEPKYNELGEKFDGDSNVVVAKIDGTANDLPKSVDVKGFPTIVFFKAGTKDAGPMPYVGGREVADMVKFINKNRGSSPSTKDEL